MDCKASRKVIRGRRPYALVAAILVALFSAMSFAQLSQEEQDKAAIRALVDKINLAWQLEKPSTLFQEILSDKGFVVTMPKPDNPSEVAIINKQKFCESLDNMMQGQQRPKKHEHKVESITVVGPLAYEIGTILHVAADGTQRYDKVMNIFAKDETGWKLVYSTPPDNVRKALRSMPGDEEQVRKVAREFLESFRLDKDNPFARAEEIFHESIAVVTSQGQFIQGRENVLKTYRQSWEEVRREFSSLDIHYDIQSVNVADDAALVFGKVKLDGRLKDANDAFHREIWETLVLQKIDDKWRIIREQSTKAGDLSADFSKTKELSPEQTRQLEENIKGSFSGIGVEIDTCPNGIYIKKALPESPADNAGLKNGEVITAINGASAVGMSVEKAVSLLKGPKGTSVNLKVLLRDGTLRDISVVRGIVSVSGVDSRILEPNIGLLAISVFNKETSAKVCDTLIYFQQQKINGLVLDLRNNKGGFFPAVKEITSMFTGPDQIMWQIQYTGQTGRTPEKGTVQKMAPWPVVVLVNSETRCGGELLASAVKSKAGGKLLGRKTFGEGVIYNLEKQADGSSKKVPTGYFYTADGQVIDGQGINPYRELDPNLSSEEVLKQAVYELTKK